MTEKMKSLNIGDKVIVLDHRGAGSVHNVSGETKLCWRIGSSLFYKEGLNERGGHTWYWKTLEEWTQEAEDTIIKKRKAGAVARKLCNMNLHNLPPDTLIAIGNCLKKATGAE